MGGGNITEYALKIRIPNRLDYFLSVPLLLYRFLRYGYTYRRIPLTRGKYAIVDPDDYYHLSKHRWHAVRGKETFYAARWLVNKAGRKCIQMHRAILKVPDGTWIDHINQDGLDNRKINIRPATRAQNMRNRSKYKSRSFSSKYKGVTRIRGKKLWKAHITVNRRTILLGSFQDEIAAAKAYDKAAKKYHGQFASLNFTQPKLSISRRFLAFSLTLLFYIRLHLSSSIKNLASRIENQSSSIEYSLTSPPPVRKLTNMAKKLYIIDGHAHIYAAYFAPMRPLTSPTGEATKATYIFTAAVLGLIQRHKPDMLVVALDSKAPTFRTKIYTEYKANRPPMPDDMPAQIDRIEQILEAMNIP
ncbi:MAG: hypothetical protein ACYS67_10890, partial [Planctomycetota bacterium]